MELWRCAAAVLPLRGMEIWSSGGMLRAWRRGGALQACCLKSPGALAARCRRRDVEVWKCAAGVLPLCLKSSGARPACCGPGDVEV